MCMFPHPPTLTLSPQLLSVTLSACGVVAPLPDRMGHYEGLTMTSPSVNFNIFTMGNRMSESTLSPSQELDLASGLE
jgi:hypothetical protein